jgi:integral membrane protein (TIGR01906 family)
MKAIKRAFQWVISLLTPPLLLMTAINLMISPAFAMIEYQMPGFPDDRYGFSKADRIELSRYAINYLRNQEGIEYLGDLTFPDGTPLYNQRELKHMLDVKILVGQMITSWYAALVLFVLIGVISVRKGWMEEFYQGLSTGAYLTIGIIGTILLAVATNFNSLFTAFHKVFFEGETWIFEYSDTLIRLFPIRFWQDAFIFVGSFTLLGAILIIFFSRKRFYFRPA